MRTTKVKSNNDGTARELKAADDLPAAFGISYGVLNHRTSMRL
ncbi:hypothetical protein SEHO0A_01650 [Salmonella enterica subsp. houtenae str. ATCC BAA-1581]|nr:hypothetical protein SEHO0A_01650 [Salmonella enterica subsp. houtenae str. ATCC BAA-1581]